MPSRSREIYVQVANLHAENLDKSFLATLGTTFLREMYRAIDLAENSTLIVEERGAVVVGFVTGGSGMGPIYKAMLKRIWVWAIPLGLRLLSPKRILRVIDILRYGEGDASSSDIPTAELYSIAVSPDVRGEGVAQSLYQRLESYFEGEGVLAFRIIVGGALAPAHRFYQKMGAQTHGEISLHAGEISTLYIHKLGSSEA